MNSVFPEFNQSLSFQLHHLVKLMGYRANQILEQELDITFSQFRVLMMVADMSQPSQREVADCLDVTAAAISRHIDGMCDRGLILKQQKPDNRREHVLALTQVGVRKIDAARQLLHNSFDALVSEQLSEREVAQLQNSIQKIATAFEATTPQQKGGKS